MFGRLEINLLLMFFKNNKLPKITRFFAAGILFIMPLIAAAQFTTGPKPAGLVDLDLKDVLENIIVWILGFIGLLGIIFLVYGGLRYVTSAGSESEAEEAKKIITYAIIGLFLTASAYAIVTTVVDLMS